MSANKIVRFGPTLLTNTLTTILYAPPATTGGTGVPPNCGFCYFIFRHLRVTNATPSPANVTISVGSGGCIFDAALVQAQGSAQNWLDWSGALRIDGLNLDVLVGGASIASALTVEGEGEIGIS